MKNNEILLLFDLDFTLIDNREGIINSFNHALTSMNYSKLPSSEIEPMIGEPLEDMFSRYVKGNVKDFITIFREYYTRKGIKELEFLDGAREKIIELHELGFNLGILTSKKEQLAQILIQNKGLSQYFKIILGSTPERKKKNSPKLIELLIEKLPEIKHYCMIGDHQSDAEVSELLKCPFVGLLSGKSTRDGLIKATSMKNIILETIGDLTSEIILKLFE